MNLKSRVERLENLIGVFDEDPPLILIKIASGERGSKDQGRFNIAIVPGPACGHKGAFLTRDEDEDQDAFLSRCSKRYDGLYEP